MLFSIAGFLIGAGTAYLVARGIYRAGLAAGYLDGRNFLIKRRVLLRSTVWIDGLPLERAAAVWIETNDFAGDERDRVDALADWEARSGLPTEVYPLRRDLRPPTSYHSRAD